MPSKRRNPTRTKRILRRDIRQDHRDNNSRIIEAMAMRGPRGVPMDIPSLRMIHGGNQDSTLHHKACNQQPIDLQATMLDRASIGLPNVR
jgi:hypothetical protein